MKGQTNAELMREWRRLRGLTRVAAGEELGVNYRTIEAIEQGRRHGEDGSSTGNLIQIALKALVAEAKNPKRKSDHTCESA